MPKTIQLRHVPDPLHPKLKSRAALEGLSWSDCLLREIGRIAEWPTLAGMEQRLSRQKPVRLDVSVVDVIRAEIAMRDCR